MEEVSIQFLESHALGKPLVPLKTKLFFHKNIPWWIVSILLSRSHSSCYSGIPLILFMLSLWQILWTWVLSPHLVQLWARRKTEESQSQCCYVTFYQSHLTCRWGYCLSESYLTAFPWKQSHNSYLTGCVGMQHMESEQHTHTHTEETGRLSSRKKCRKVPKHNYNC